MGFLEELSKETIFRRRKYPKKYFGYKRYEFFEIRPLFDMKNNLLYHHANVLYEDEVCLVMAKKSQDVIYKYIIIYDLNAYKNLHLTNELLVSYNLGKKFEYGFMIEDLGVLKMIEIPILAEMTEANIRYAIINTAIDGKTFRTSLVFDKDWNILVQFLMNKESGEMYKCFKKAVYQDLGAKDVEDI